MESPNKASGSGFDVTDVQSNSLETLPINLKATLDDINENLNTVAKVLQNLVAGNLSSGRTEKRSYQPIWGHDHQSRYSG